MNTKETLVVAFLKTLNDDDFEAAKNYLAQGFTFKGLRKRRLGIDQFIDAIKTVEHTYTIKNIYSNGRDVCVIYDIIIPDDENVTTCGIYQVKRDKIRSMNVIFDTRTITASRGKIVIE